MKTPPLPLLLFIPLLLLAGCRSGAQIHGGVHYQVNATKPEDEAVFAQFSQEIAAAWGRATSGLNAKPCEEARIELILIPGGGGTLKVDRVSAVNGALSSEQCLAIATAMQEVAGKFRFSDPQYADFVADGGVRLTFTYFGPAATASTP